MSSEQEEKSSEINWIRRSIHHNFNVDEATCLFHSPMRQYRKAARYETIIQACGFGKFQRILLLSCGWAFVSDATEVQVVSFMSPTAQDLDMTSSEKGWLNAIIFAGMMIGGFIFGGTADIKGRRYVLLWSMAVNGLFGLLSAFVPSFVWFLLTRFFSGIGVGAALPVLFSYFAEFLSKEHRGPMIGLLASFLMVGNILSAGLAWFIIPLQSQRIKIGDVYVSSWRVFVGVCSLPALSATIIFYFLPESPKFLLKKGRVKEARDIFTKIYQANNRKNDQIPYVVSQCNNFNEDDFYSESKISIGAQVYTSTKSIFKKNLRSPTVTLLVIWFTLSFGYYGLWMWLPEMFKRIQNGGPKCGVSDQARSTNESQLEFNNSFYRFTEEKNTEMVNHGIYLQSFIVSVANLPGNVITVTLINKVGRRGLLGTSLILSSLNVFYFQLVSSKVKMLLIACIFSSLSIVTWNVLNAVALENYPTQLRSTAFGVQTSFGRVASILANITFGFLMDVNCMIPLGLVSILFLIGGIVVFNLPRTDDVILT